MSSSHYNFNSTTPEIESKIDALLAKMTLEKKVDQTVKVNIHEGNRKEIIKRIKKGHVGSVLTIYRFDKINTVQKVAIKETRLGIPIIFENDIIHGYRTIFPIPLTEACTWNIDLIEQGARNTAKEATADGVNWTFAPMVDICRDPRWDQIAEGAGEDLI